MKNAMWWVLGSRTFAAFVCVFFLGCLLTACKSEEERGFEKFAPSGAEQLLEPGGYIVGVDGFRVRAPEGALEEAIWITIERVEHPKAMPLQDGVKHVGSAYRVRGRERQNFDRIPLLFELPLPEVSDIAGVAAVFLVPAKWRLHSSDEQDVWEAIDGSPSEDEQRFVVDGWGLDESGLIVALVEGIYFTHWPADELDEFDDDDEEHDGTLGLKRSLLSPARFHIVCDGNEEEFCDAETRRHARSVFLRAFRDFNRRGFNSPRLATTWFGIDAYKVYLKRVQIGEGNQDCNYSMTRGKWGGVSGKYTPSYFSKKLVVCVFDKDRTSINVSMNKVLPGDVVRIYIGDSVYEQLFDVGTTLEVFIDAIESQVRGNVDVGVSSHDGWLVIMPRNHKRIAVLRAEHEGKGSIRWNRFDREVEATMRHEYVHALQFGYNNFNNNFGSIPLAVIEGIASAAENSLDEMIRAPGRNPLGVDVKLFRMDASKEDPELYEVQDFFVFLGKRINVGIDYLIPFLRRGGLVSDLAEFMQKDYPQSNYSLQQAYWDWARNQGVEKSIDLGNSGLFESINYCRTDNENVRFDLRGETNRLEQTEKLEALSSKIALIMLGPYMEDRVVRLSAEASNSAIRTAFYDDVHGETSGCHGTSHREEQIVEIPARTTKVFYVLAANTHHGSPGNVTFSAEFDDFEAPTVKITEPGQGAVFAEGKDIFAMALFSYPTDLAALKWAIGSEEIGVSTHGAGKGSFEGYIGRACPAGGTFMLQAVLEDERGFIARDEVEVTIEETSKVDRLQVRATVAGESSVTVSGGSLSVPVRMISGSWRVPDILLEPDYNTQSCDILPSPNPADYQWSSGGVVLKSGADYLVQDQFFDLAGRRRAVGTIEVTHTTVTSAKTSIRLTPCDPTPFGETKLPWYENYSRCPDSQLVEMIRDGLNGVATDLYRKRKEIDIMVTLQDRLNVLFGGLVPEPFPGYGDMLAVNMTDPSLGIMVYELYGVMRGAQSISQLREDIVARAVTADKFLAPRELENYMHISTLAEVHLDFFASYRSGGNDGWWHLDTLATADAFSESQIIGLVRTAMDGFMSGFHFNNVTGQATPAAMELGTQAAVLSALMGAVELGGF